jgi:thiol-disulfide isomerase/thioredoxin
MTQRHILLCVLFGLILTSCTRGSGCVTSNAPKVIKWDELAAVIEGKSKKLQVINFWATWCAPCIKELPYFEAVNKNSCDQIDVTLVSLDFEDEFEKRVLPFVDKRNLQAQVLLLDEIDYNSWIDKVDPSWSGAIPATLIVNPVTGERKFMEKEMNEAELNTLIEELLN